MRSSLRLLDEVDERTGGWTRIEPAPHEVLSTFGPAVHCDRPNSCRIGNCFGRQQAHRQPFLYEPEKGFRSVRLESHIALDAGGYEDDIALLSTCPASGEVGEHLFRQLREIDRLSVSKTVAGVNNRR